MARMNRRKNPNPKPTESCRDFPRKVSERIPIAQLGAIEERAKLPKGKLGKWLGGSSYLYADEAWRLAEALAVSVEYLLNDGISDPSQAPPLLTVDQKRILGVVREMDLKPEDVLCRLSHKPHEHGLADPGTVTDPEPDPEGKPKPRSHRKTKG